MMIGLTALLWLTNARGAALTGFDLAPALMIYGTGQGFVMPTLISTILINIRGHDAGSAAGVLSTVQQLSFATGVAVIGTVFFSALAGLTDLRLHCGVAYGFDRQHLLTRCHVHPDTASPSEPGQSALATGLEGYTGRLPD